MSSTTLANEEFISQADAARRCGVRPLTVWRWIETGMLPTVGLADPNAKSVGRPGKSRPRKLLKRDVDAFMETHRITQCPPGLPNIDGRRAKRAYRVRRGRPYVGTFVVASACGIGRCQAINWIDSGVIPASRDPERPTIRKRQVKRVDLLAFLERNGYAPEAMEIARNLP